MEDVKDYTGGYSYWKYLVKQADPYHLDRGYWQWFGIIAMFVLPAVTAVMTYLTYYMDYEATLVGLFFIVPTLIYMIAMLREWSRRKRGLIQ